MFYKLKKGKQKELIQRAITKAGSERKLCKIIAISKGAIHRSRSESCNISKEKLQKISKFLHIDIQKYYIPLDMAILMTLKVSCISLKK